jgi:hypothetical protein
MKTIYAVTVPACSAQFCAALQEAFDRSSFTVNVTQEAPEQTKTVIERLQSPIEPAGTSQTLYIGITHEAPLSVLSETLLNETFVMQLVHTSPSVDLFALECLVATCIAREVTQTYLLSTTAPARVMNCARKTATRNSWIERTLGTPSATELFGSFADALIARGTR